MADYDADIDAIEQDIRDGEGELKQTTAGYTKVKPFPPGPNTHWGKGLSFLDAAEIKLEELRVKLVPPLPPPSQFEPRELWKDRIWAPDARSRPVDTNSAAMILAWVNQGFVWPNMPTNSAYATAWAVGKAGDPLYDVTTTKYPIGKVVKGIPIPAGTKGPGKSLGDGHLTVFDLVNGRTIDLWRAQYLMGEWTAGSCDEYPLGGVPLPRQGSNAAGFPQLATAIWPEEIAAGEIPHALGYTVLRARDKNLGTAAFRFPATKSDGTGSATDTPEGAHLWMPSSVAPNTAWPKLAKIVFACLQKHGMYCKDQGGTLGLDAVCPVNGGMTWPQAGIGDGTEESVGGSKYLPADFPWSKMEVLVPPAP